MSMYRVISISVDHSLLETIDGFVESETYPSRSALVQTHLRLNFNNQIPVQELFFLIRHYLTLSEQFELATKLLDKLKDQFNGHSKENGDTS